MLIQVWNSVGLIRQYNTDEENSIDIEFHDTSTHHALHITNTMNHTMGDLSSEAAILACESDDDSPSRLVCMHFSSWDNVKEWSVSMPGDEDIMVTYCTTSSMPNIIVWPRFGFVLFAKLIFCYSFQIKMIKYCIISPWIRQKHVQMVKC